MKTIKKILAAIVLFAIAFSSSFAFNGEITKSVEYQANEFYVYSGPADNSWNDVEHWTPIGQVSPNCPGSGAICALELPSNVDLETYLEENDMSYLDALQSLGEIIQKSL